MKNIFKKIIVGSLMVLSLVGFSHVVLHTNFIPRALAAVANKIPTTVALYEDSLQSAITSSATSFTLVRGTDVVGTSLATSTYGFIIDEGSASQEFVLADCTATACTNALRGISPITGLTEVPALKKAHRRGASVKITDAPILLILGRLANGTEAFPNILSYVTHPTFSSDTQIVDKKYVDDATTAGAPDASTTVKGIVEEATQSEVNAGTATGGTGARLFVNPSTLLTSNYGVFLPSSGQKDALVGTSGTPSSSNKYVTNDDVAVLATADKVARRLASGNVTVITETAFDNSTKAASTAYVDRSSGSVSSSDYVLGESFTGATTPQPATVIDDLYQFGITNLSTKSGSGKEFGLTSGNSERKALKVIPRANVTVSSIRLQLAKTGTPTDNVSIEIQTDTAGSPSGTVITNGTSTTISGSSLSTSSSTEVNLTFSSPTLTSGTTYWFVFKRSGSLDSSNYFSTAGLEASFAYGSFEAKTYVSGTWTNTSNYGTIPFAQIYTSSGKSLSLWKSDSDSSSWILNQFQGFVTTTGSAGDPATLVKSGTLSGFSGLSVGADYTTSATAGSITASGGGVFVGNALSSTQINIPRIKNGDAITSNFFSIGSTTELAGNSFRYKLPYNGIFAFYWNSSGTGTDVKVYSGNIADTYTLTYENSQGSGVDLLTTVPYTRGQYINFTSSGGSGTMKVSFTPIIE